MKTNKEKKQVFNVVNVESLFNALYTTGSAKLSDHFIKDSDGGE